MNSYDIFYIHYYLLLIDAHSKLEIVGKMNQNLFSKARISNVMRFVYI